MTLKGNYGSGVSYSVGDVVLYTDDVVYFLREAASVGTPCTDTRYWQKLDQKLAEAVKLILDGMAIEHVTIANNLSTTAAGKVLDARQGKALNDKITPLQTTTGTLTTDVEALKAVVTTPKTLVLASSTPDSTKKFTITVDDAGKVTASEIIYSE